MGVHRNVDHAGFRGAGKPQPKDPWDLCTLHQVPGRRGVERVSGRRTALGHPQRRGCGDMHAPVSSQQSCVWRLKGRVAGGARTGVCCGLGL